MLRLISNLKNIHVRVLLVTLLIDFGHIVVVCPNWLKPTILVLRKMDLKFLLNFDIHSSDVYCCNIDLCRRSCQTYTLS